MSLRKMSTEELGKATLVVVLGCLLLAIPALADSRARIVRLSDVEGSYSSRSQRWPGV